MRSLKWERYAPLTGVLAIALWFVAFLIIEGIGDTPGEDATPQEYLTYFAEEEGSIYGGTFVFALGSIAFIWFVGSLRAALAGAEGVPGRVSGIAFAGGVGTFVEKNFAPEAAQALWFAYDGFFVAIGFTSLVLTLATGLVVLRTGVLPRWWGWITLLVSLTLLVYPLVWLAIIFVFTAWVVVTGVLLYSRQASGPAATAPAASTAIE